VRSWLQIDTTTKLHFNQYGELYQMDQCSRY